MLITLARKPLDGTVAANVLRWGVGGLNVDGCRIGTNGDSRPLIASQNNAAKSTYGNGLNGSRSAGTTSVGRWPANLLVTSAAAETMDAQSGIQTFGVAVRHRGVAPAAGASLTGMGGKPIGTPDLGHYDKGGASRFFKKVGSDPC